MQAAIRALKTFRGNLLAAVTVSLFSFVLDLVRWFCGTIWTTRSGSREGSIPRPQPGQVWGAAVHPRSPIVATCGEDVRFWNVALDVRGASRGEAWGDGA